MSCTTECPKWVTSGWTSCSASCGHGRIHRQVRCELDGRKVSNIHCDASLKPEETDTCYPRECPKWSTGSWGACSATDCYNSGVRKRLVKYYQNLILT